MANIYVGGNGGGSGKLFAAIGVTYPVGSTLTCAKVGGDTLTWDGNTEGLVSVRDMFYKVSDATPTKDKIGTNYSIVFKGGYVSEPTGFTNVADGVIADPLMSVVVVSENGVGVTISGAAFTETGTYFKKADGDYVSSFTIPGYTGFGGGGSSKTLRAKTTTGKYIFAIPEAGTWVVTCSAGEQKASRNVIITRADKGVLKTITLAYSGYLYNRGTFAPDVLYKAKVTDGATVTAEATQYTMKSPTNSVFEMYLVFEQINLTYLDKLSFTYSCSANSGSVVGCIFVSKDYIRTYTDAELIESRIDSRSVSGQTIELDVSEAVGDYYVYVGTNSQGSSWKNARTLNILEVAFA